LSFYLGNEQILIDIGNMIVGSSCLFHPFSWFCSAESTTASPISRYERTKYHRSRPAVINENDVLWLAVGLLQHSLAEAPFLQAFLPKPAIGQSEDELDGHISQPISHSLPTMTTTSGKALALVQILESGVPFKKSSS